MSSRRPSPTQIALDELNRKFEELRDRVDRELQTTRASTRWWVDHAGRFENDPVFAEIVRLGKAQRKLLNKNRHQRRKKRARS
jgi:hypothetical protein